MAIDLETLGTIINGSLEVGKLLMKLAVTYMQVGGMKPDEIESYYQSVKKEYLKRDPDDLPDV